MKETSRRQSQSQLAFTLLIYFFVKRVYMCNCYDNNLLNLWGGAKYYSGATDFQNIMFFITLISKQNYIPQYFKHCTSPPLIYSIIEEFNTVINFILLNAHLYSLSIDRKWIFIIYLLGKKNPRTMPSLEESLPSHSMLLCIAMIPFLCRGLGPTSSVH